MADLIEKLGDGIGQRSWPLPDEPIFGNPLEEIERLAAEYTAFLIRKAMMPPHVTDDLPSALVRIAQLEALAVDAWQFRAPPYWTPKRGRPKDVETLRRWTLVSNMGTVWEHFGGTAGLATGKDGKPEQSRFRSFVEGWAEMYRPEGSSDLTPARVRYARNKWRNTC